MKRGLQGRYVTISTVGEKVQAFVPAPLPPRPPIDWTPGGCLMMNIILPNDVTGSRISAGHRGRHGNTDRRVELC